MKSAFSDRIQQNDNFLSLNSEYFDSEITQLTNKQIKTSDQQTQDNIFYSCIYNKRNSDQQDQQMDIQIQQIIEQNIIAYMKQSQKLMQKGSSPYLPLTFTLWRQVAIDRIKQLIIEQSLNINQNNMAKFCKQVDQKLLFDQFYPLMTNIYYEKIKEHQQYVPQELAKYLPLIDQSEQYKKLLQCLCEWLVLIEFCTDLLNRVQTYGIASYIDEQILEKKLKENWSIKQDQKFVDNQSFTNMIRGFSGIMSSWMQWFGIATLIQQSIVKWVFGIYWVHPAVFVGSIITGIFLKVGTDQLETNMLLSELEKVTAYFSIITSNLHSNYIYAQECVLNSFLTKDIEKVTESIQNLIEGYGKDNEGSFQKFFDERDQQIKKIELQEDQSELKDWVNVNIEKLE